MKYLFLATEDNAMQLMHILLNAIHFCENGHEVRVVFECASPKLFLSIADGSVKMPHLSRALELGIVDHACKACTATFNATEAAEKLGIRLKGELHGHSNLLTFVDSGYSLFRF